MVFLFPFPGITINIRKKSRRKVVENILKNRIKEETNIEEYYYLIYGQFLESRYIERLRGLGVKPKGERWGVFKKKKKKTLYHNLLTGIQLY